MSHQRGTPVNALYHRRLAVLLVRADGLHLTPTATASSPSDSTTGA